MTHLSHTQLNLYDRCPRAYGYRYVRGLKLEPTEAMELGRALHSAIAEYLIYLRTSDVGRDIKAAEGYAAEGYTLSNLGPTAWGDMREQMSKFAEYHWWKSDEILGVEVKLEAVMSEGLNFVAIADLVQKNEASVKLVDFKTSRSFPREGDPLTRLQLERYAWTFAKAEGLGFERGLDLEVDYVRWWGSAMNPTDMIRVGANRIGEIERRLKADALRCLYDGEFKARPSSDCATCGYQRQCVEEGVHLPIGLPLESATAAGDLLRRYVAVKAEEQRYHDALKAYGEKNGPVVSEDIEFSPKLVTTERLDKEALKAVIGCAGDWSRFVKVRQSQRWEVRKVERK